jgi:hypothetical protein
MGNEGASLGEFQPLPATAASCAKEGPTAQVAPIPGIGGSARVVQPAAAEGFDNAAGTTTGANVFDRLLPLYTEAAAATGGQPAAGQPQNDLMRKLNRIIHMLEDQEDVRTGHVGEELVLYGFLGVFVIFIVDSFARAGKYVR